MSAAEYGFPEPEDAPATYLEVSKNCFNNIVSRWDESSCGGGLKWQIYPENDYGYNYKNSISNGAAFALGARLARFTGNQTYADWAEKIYDWEKQVGLIGDKFEVFDGTDDKSNCKEVADKTEWTYNNAMMIHGSAFMASYTKDDKWTQRTEGFLTRAAIFFHNPKQVKDVMFEVCEHSAGGKNCNLDQQSFKAYLGRWMAKTALLVPSTKDQITKYLTTSASAAAKSCTGDDGACGSRWYQDFDGETGVGQQMSAMEVTQACLMIQQGTLPGTGGESEPEPKPKPSSSAAPKSSSTAAAESNDTPKSTEAPKSEDASSKAPKSSEAAPPASEASVGYPTGAPAANTTSSQSDTASVPTDIPQLSYSEGVYAPIETPAPTSTPISKPGGQFGEAKNSTAPACTCTGKKTTTVYVNPPTEATPPPAPPAPPASNSTPTVVPTGALPPSPPPPANSSGAESFLGAASSVKMGASTVFAAAGLAVLAAFL
jgi:mannan endo-1,6-alpha-mannosidase